MKDQHEKITGYRDLTEEEIAALNEIKAKAEELGALIERLDHLPNPGNVAPVMIDKRWLNIARTNLQQGFMALSRSVARPTTF